MKGFRFWPLIHRKLLAADIPQAQEALQDPFARSPPILTDPLGVDEGVNSAGGSCPDVCERSTALATALS